MANTGIPSDADPAATPPPTAAPPRRAALGKIALVAALVAYLATGCLILYRPG